MKLGYAVSEIRKHGLDTTWWRKRFLSHIIRPYYNLRPNQGTSVLDEDWDNLLILDACRYDLFAEVADNYDIPGQVETRQSLNSATPGFLQDTFDDGTYHDIVYVNANPYLSIILDRKQFHAVDSVWEDAWDEENQTVLPEVVANRAREAAEQYPNKRLIVHFIQPHYPFVGETSLGTHEVFGIREQARGNDDAVQKNPTPFQLLERDEISESELWKAYRSNLELVMPLVEQLFHELSGRTALTADHGNAIGEYAKPFPIRVYGHPNGLRIPALTTVPWVTNQNGDRREIVPEPPEDTGKVDSDTQERLRMLGYAE